MFDTETTASHDFSTSSQAMEAPEKAPQALSVKPPPPPPPPPPPSIFAFATGVEVPVLVPLEEERDSYCGYRNWLRRESDRFWFEDGTVVIQVNHILYKLYKGILTQQSEYFKSRITAVFQSPEIVSGKKGKKTYSTVKYGDPQLVGIGSHSDPLILDVKRTDFELLLSYMFPKDYNSQNTFTVLEWASIAAVSKTLEMASVRAAAITNILKTTDPLDLVDVGKKHNITQCSSEGFRLLCVREGSLSLEEGQRLGLQSVIAIAHGRDLLSRDSKWSEIEKAVLMEAGITSF